MLSQAESEHVLMHSPLEGETQRIAEHLLHWSAAQPDLQAEGMAGSLQLSLEHLLGVEAWLSLGAAGGGTVAGRGYTEAECFIGALELQPRCVDAWLSLGAAGGGEVSVGDPVLDLEESYVVSVDRGITNRFRGSDLEQEAQRVAVAQMSEAAEGTGPLVELAESNTIAMLEGLLEALGHEDVSVTFAG